MKGASYRAAGLRFNEKFCHLEGTQELLLIKNESFRMIEEDDEIFCRVLRHTPLEVDPRTALKLAGGIKYSHWSGNIL